MKLDLKCSKRKFVFFQSCLIIFIISFYQLREINAAPTVLNDNLSKIHFNKELERLDEFSRQLSDSLNPHIDPCTDYIGHVTGNLTKAPGFEVAMDISVIKDIYDKFIGRKTWKELSSIEKKAKTFFNSCYFGLDESYEDAIKNFLDEIQKFGNWPILNENKLKLNRSNELIEIGNTDKDDWIEIDGKLNVFDSSLIEIRVLGENKENLFHDGKDTSYKNGGIVTYTIAPTKQYKFFLMDRRVYSEDHFEKIFNAYNFTNLQDPEKLLKLKKSFLNLEKQFRHVKQNSNFHSIDDNRNDDDDDGDRLEISFGDLENIQFLNEFNWELYFISATGIQPRLTDRVIILRKIILNEFLEILQKSDKNLLQNYLFFRLNAYLRHEYQFSREYRMQCYENVYHQFRNVFLNILLQNYIDENDSYNYHNIIENIFTLLNDHFNKETLQAGNRFHNVYENFRNIILNKNHFKSSTNKEYAKLSVVINNYLINLLRSNVYNKLDKRIYHDSSIISSFTEKDLNHISAAIYTCHRKPTIFYEIYFGIPGYLKFFSDTYKNFLINKDEHCIDFNPERFMYKSIEYVLLLPEFQKINKQISDDEFNKQDILLESYNLNRVKILFISLTQSVLRKATPSNSYLKEYIIKFLGNFDEFGKEYNCNELSPLNPKYKCKF